MKIGDIEYTRKVNVVTDTAQESDHTPVAFALGIQVRALLTRVHVHPGEAGAVTGSQGFYLENGNSIPEDTTTGNMRADQRALPLWVSDMGLATNGMGIVSSFETQWWKLLLPDVQLIGVASVLAAVSAEIILHYRFAVLTDDEIIEIAAQRAQS